MLDLLKMDQKQILALNPNQINWFLSTEEIIHIADVVRAHWKYDILRTRKELNFHAQLKGLEHSDEFFYSEILFSFSNIRKIIATQISNLFNQLGIFVPDWIVGIPKGAKVLGDEVAEILHTKSAVLEKKEDGGMVLISNMAKGDRVLIIDDFSSAGTGVRDVVQAISSKQRVCFIPFALFALNRGGKKIISTAEGDFIIKSLGNYKTNHWPSSECPLCKKGSIPIKPKDPVKNWNLLTNQSLLVLLHPFAKIKNKYERIAECQSCVWEQWCDDPGHPDLFWINNDCDVLVCVMRTRDKLEFNFNPAKS